jgi:ketosteroid isomerase-like protein
MSDQASANRATDENVELLRRFYESFNQGDLDSVLELCTEDVEVYKDPEVVDMVAASTPRGLERVAQYLRGWLDSWSEYHARPQEFLQTGEDVAALTQLRARGKNSQFEIEGEMADVFTVRDGRIARFRLYIQRTDALGSLGITA